MTIGVSRGLLKWTGFNYSRSSDGVVMGYWTNKQIEEIQRIGVAKMEPSKPRVLKDYFGL